MKRLDTPTPAALATATAILTADDPAATTQMEFESEQQELAKLIDEKTGLPQMMNALLAVLLFHKVGHWTQEDRNLWTHLTWQEDKDYGARNAYECTTRGLCDFIRAALPREPVEQLSHEHGTALTRPNLRGF